MNLLFKLFIAFIQVGMFSVGGGYAAIPLIQDQVVTRYSLLSFVEFSDLVTIAEMTPGPISINAATFVGQRVFGFWGALICTIAVILAPFIISLSLAWVYYRFKNLSFVQKVLKAMRPAVVALIANAGISILLLALFGTDKIKMTQLRHIEFILFIISFYILRKYKVNAVGVILGTGIFGVIYSFIF